jgi:hypothetical protein
VRFFTTHGKQKQLTAPAPNGVGQPLPCAEIKTRAPPGKTHGKHRPFAVRLPKNARQTGPFAVRHHKKRTANIF